MTLANLLWRRLSYKQSCCIMYSIHRKYRKEHTWKLSLYLQSLGQLPAQYRYLDHLMHSTARAEFKNNKIMISIIILLIIDLKVKSKGKSNEREQILLSPFDPFSLTLASRKAKVRMALSNAELFSTTVKSQFHLSVSSEASNLFQNKKSLISIPHFCFILYLFHYCKIN